MSNSEDYQLRVLIQQETIEKKILEVSKQINEDYKGEEVLALSVLKGGVIFAADLVRQLTMPLQLDFIQLSSYGVKKESSGDVQGLSVDHLTIKGHHILIVEDIVDTGLTLIKLKDLLLSKGAASVKIVACCYKKEKADASLVVDYFCFELGDDFVVGYGMDFAQKHRNLPYIGVMDERKDD